MALTACVLSGGRFSTAADPDYRIDRTGWARQNRIVDAVDQPRSDEFDTTATGLWLKRWGGGGSW